MLSSQMHSCHAKLFRQVSNACPQVAEHLRRKADVLGQLPWRAEGRLPGRWSSKQCLEQHAGNCSAKVFMDGGCFCMQR